jgi:hypothetical protein
MYRASNRSNNNELLNNAHSVLRFVLYPSLLKIFHAVKISTGYIYEEVKLPEVEALLYSQQWPN